MDKNISHIQRFQSPGYLELDWFVALSEADLYNSERASFEAWLIPPCEVKGAEAKKNLVVDLGHHLFLKQECKCSLAASPAVLGKQRQLQGSSSQAWVMTSGLLSSCSKAAWLECEEQDSFWLLNGQRLFLTLCVYFFFSEESPLRAELGLCGTPGFFVRTMFPPQ